MKFTLRHGKHQKSSSTAQAPNQPTYLTTAAIPVTNPNAASEFGTVLIVPSRNSVNVVDKAGQIIMSSPMDRSAFKDLEESVALLGPNPNVETVDCKGIAESIMDHFDSWYSEVKQDGSTQEDIVDLLKEMMMYATKRHPMVMASPVAGPEIIGIIFNNVLERIEDTPDE